MLRLPLTWGHRQGYAQINFIGHSLGAAIALEEAAIWPRDPAHLVLTGLRPELNAAEFTDPQLGAGNGAACGDQLFCKKFRRIPVISAGCSS